MRLLAAFLLLLATGSALPQEKRSGYEQMGRELRAMQDDDFANPGMLAVLDGEALWKASGCASCHAAAAMKGVAARYPSFDSRKNKVLNLEQRINGCRVEKQNAKPWAYESAELLSITAYVANQSRGLPIAVDFQDSKSSWETGRGLFFRRLGQLNLSCAQCHDERAGLKLGGSPIPQAHPTGYPIYRLEWQGMGSLQRRLRNCMIGMRAQPYEFGAQELVDLELYLMARASGLKVETPAVRP